MALWWIKTCRFKNPTLCKLSRTTLFPLRCVALTLSRVTVLPICWGGEGFHEVNCPRPQSGVQRCWGLSEAPHRTGVPRGPWPEAGLSQTRPDGSGEGHKEHWGGKRSQYKRLSASGQSQLASLRSVPGNWPQGGSQPPPHPGAGFLQQVLLSNKSLPMHFHSAGPCGCGSRWTGTALSQSQGIGRF